MNGKASCNVLISNSDNMITTAKIIANTRSTSPKNLAIWSTSAFGNGNQVSTHNRKEFIRPNSYSEDDRQHICDNDEYAGYDG